MDYTNILNSINNNLSAILSLLQSFDSGNLMNYFILLFTIFLLLYIMRGE